MLLLLIWLLIEINNVLCVEIVFGFEFWLWFDNIWNMCLKNLIWIKFDMIVRNMLNMIKIGISV